MVKPPVVITPGVSAGADRSLALPASRADGLGYLVNAGRPYSWVTTYRPDPTGAHMPAELQTTAVST